MLSFFPRDVLDEIWNLIASVSEGFPALFSYLLFKHVKYGIQLSGQCWPCWSYYLGGCNKGNAYFILPTKNYDIVVRVGKMCNPHPHPRWKTRVGIL